jgi:hypothetical protein
MPAGDFKHGKHIGRRRVDGNAYLPVCGTHQTGKVLKLIGGDEARCAKNWLLDPRGMGGPPMFQTDTRGGPSVPRGLEAASNRQNSSGEG